MPIIGTQRAELRPFTRVLNQEDLNMGIADTDVVCPSTAYTKIAYYQVPAQQQIAIGAGVTTAGGLDTREYVKITLYEASVEVVGKLRIAYTNANETNIQVIKEERSDNLTGGATVRIGETQNLRVGEDSYIVIYFKPDVTTTIDCSVATNDILLPVTVYQ